MLEAHYTNGGTVRPAQLALAVCENGRRTWISRQPVNGKAEARKLAREAGATPWNF
jgi:hypothetical protein